MGGANSHPVDMDGPEAEFVRTVIHDKRVVVFSKTHCGACRVAKGVLDDLKAKYEVVELDKRNDGNTIQSVLEKMTGARTVPRVFIDGKCIGGGTETEKLRDSGELETMLRDCNAI